MMGGPGPTSHVSRFGYLLEIPPESWPRRRFCYTFSEAASMAPWLAAPLEGSQVPSLGEQLASGPWSGVMLAGCLLFWIPAGVHLWHYCLRPRRAAGPRPHAATTDLLAALSLGAVGVSSPLCDAFLVYSGSYLNDPATGEPFFSPQAGQPGPLVLANDAPNSASRLLDRCVCVLVFASAIVFYRLVCQFPEFFRCPPRRPGMGRLAAWLRANWDNRTLPLLLWLSLAVAVCQAGQRLRKQNSCEVGSEPYVHFSYFHTAWHVMLALGFVFNALDRREERGADAKAD